MDNANSQEYLEKIQIQVIENLKRTTTHAPSVQMTEVPRDSMGINDEDDAALDDMDEDTHPDQRKTKRQWDKYIERDDELSASEDEDENERNGVRRQPGMKRKRNIMNYQNPAAVPDDEDMLSGAVSPSRGNGVRNGGTKPNGSAHDSNRDEDGDVDSNLGDDESDLDDPAANEDPTSQQNPEDEDLDMEDDFGHPPSSFPTTTTTTNPTTTATNPPQSPQRQEATPPDSPPQMAAQAPAPIQAAVNDMGNEDMDEGDTIEESEAREAGREEREQEDISGEKVTAVVARQEGGT